MKKNIAVVINYFYPDTDATSTVFNRYLNNLKNVYNFHIITVTSIYKYLPYDDDKIKVYYVSNLWHKFRSFCEYKYKTNGNLFYKVLICLFRIRTYLLSTFMYPISTKWVIGKYVDMLDKINNEVGIDCVISVSGLIQPQFAGLKFKNRHPDIKWITIFTDPFTGLHYYYPDFCIKSLRKKRNFKNELKIYNTADFNFLHEELYDGAIIKFHQRVNKTIQLHYALDDIRSRTPKRIIEPTNRIRLIYAGMLYKIIRNPEYMLSVISSIPEIFLDMYVFGHECDDVVKGFVSESIRLHERVNKQRYDEMICNEYDVLINIGNNSSNQTPSKTLELLSTGRPIVNFYYNKDSQYEMINKYPLGINIGRDDKDAVKKVRLFCIEMKGKQLPFEEVERLYPEKNINKQTLLIKEIIDR